MSNEGKPQPDVTDEMPTLPKGHGAPSDQVATQKKPGGTIVIGPKAADDVIDDPGNRPKTEPGTGPQAEPSGADGVAATKAGLPVSKTLPSKTRVPEADNPPAPDATSPAAAKLPSQAAGNGVVWVVGLAALVLGLLAGGLFLMSRRTQPTSEPASEAATKTATPATPGDTTDAAAPGPSDSGATQVPSEPDAANTGSPPSASGTSPTAPPKPSASGGTKPPGWTLPEFPTAFPTTIPSELPPGLIPSGLPFPTAAPPPGTTGAGP